MWAPRYLAILALPRNVLDIRPDPYAHCAVMASAVLSLTTPVVLYFILATAWCYPCSLCPDSCSTVYDYHCNSCWEGSRESASAALLFAVDNVYNAYIIIDLPACLTGYVFPCAVTDATTRSGTRVLYFAHATTISSSEIWEIEITKGIASFGIRSGQMRF